MMNNEWMNECQMKRPDSKSSCYAQTKIDIYFPSFFVDQTHMEALAGLLCLSHISSAAECQYFLWPSSKDLSICPILLHFALWVAFRWFILSYLFLLHCCGAALNHRFRGNYTPFHIDSRLYSKCHLFRPLSRRKCEAKLITGEVQRGHIFCIHRRSTRSFFHHVMPPCSLKKRWLTTSHAPHIFSLGLSPLSLHRGHSLSHPHPHPPAPAPSLLLAGWQFWVSCCLHS